MQPAWGERVASAEQRGSAGGHVRRHSASPRLRRGRSRGQALVEFALIAPVFFVVFFSTIEFALLTASIGSFNFASRDGARLGSLLGRTDASVDSEVVTVIRGHVYGLVMAKTQEIDIYRSTSNGQCLTSGNSTTTVDDASCLKNQYRIDGSVMGSIQWPVSARNDSLQGADYLGVRIVYRYVYLTGFIAGLGTPLNLTATSVQRIEPQDYQGTGFVGQPERPARHSPALTWRAPARAPAPGLLSGLLVAVLPEGRGDSW